MRVSKYVVSKPNHRSQISSAGFWLKQFFWSRFFVCNFFHMDVTLGTGHQILKGRKSNFGLSFSHLWTYISLKNKLTELLRKCKASVPQCARTNTWLIPAFQGSGQDLALWCKVPCKSKVWDSSCLQEFAFSAHNLQGGRLSRLRHCKWLTGKLKAEPSSPAQCLVW